MSAGYTNPARGIGKNWNTVIAVLKECLDPVGTSVFIHYATWIFSVSSIFNPELSINIAVWIFLVQKFRDCVPKPSGFWF